MIQIGKRTLGASQPTYIIAEVGSNWGSLQDCLTSIAMAKTHGADAVKFQMFTAEELYGRREMKMDGELPREWLPHLKEKADACGIDLILSCFSYGGVKYAVPFVSALKIASAEAGHPDIVRACKESGKVTFVSCGAHYLEEFAAIHKDWPKGRFVAMYCHAEYPSTSGHMERGLIDLEKVTGREVGLSDHTLDVITVPSLARSLEAVAIEKHVNFVNATSPDAAHSLTAEQFQTMVKAIRGEPIPQAIPRDMLLRHKRRMIAIRDIQPGEAFEYEIDFGFYRSLKDDDHALGPQALSHVIGKRAAKAIKLGDGIGPGDFT